MDQMVRYADLLSALFGLVGAVCLAWPAVGAVVAKRRWQRLKTISKSGAHDAESLAALARIRDHVEEDQLGDSQGALGWNAAGFVLLALSFAALLVAAIARASGGAS